MPKTLTKVFNLTFFDSNDVLFILKKGNKKFVIQKLNTHE